MSEYVEFLTADGAVVRVEGAATGPAGDPYGMQPVGRAGDAAVRAAETFEQALGGVRSAAEAALRVLRGGDLRPDEVEIEFAVKLSAEAGALIARTAADAHLTVKLTWSPGTSGGPVGH
ncbi:CU044_2847 family protein [Kitasatospora sp. NPDC059571]|uniref:CU044_2847 family protein n=1 Tax=Kitasatospora sp. NPDC059571 TaxID=3346871 RepID=UPI0036B9068B